MSTSPRTLKRSRDLQMVLSLSTWQQFSSMHGYFSTCRMHCFFPPAVLPFNSHAWPLCHEARFPFIKCSGRPPASRLISAGSEEIPWKRKMVASAFHPHCVYNHHIHSFSHHFALPPLRLHLYRYIPSRYCLAARNPLQLPLHGFIAPVIYRPTAHDLWLPFA